MSMSQNCLATKGIVIGVLPTMNKGAKIHSKESLVMPVTGRCRDTVDVLQIQVRNSISGLKEEIAKENIHLGSSKERIAG